MLCAAVLSFNLFFIFCFTCKLIANALALSSYKKNKMEKNHAHNFKNKKKKKAPSLEQPGDVLTQPQQIKFIIFHLQRARTRIDVAPSAPLLIIHQKKKQKTSYHKILPPANGSQIVWLAKLERERKTQQGRREHEEKKSPIYKCGNTPSPPASLTHNVVFVLFFFNYNPD